MTDRELIEAAARAAGLHVVGDADRMVAFPGNKAGGLVYRNDRGGDSLWSPLTGDGDALRLAVKLGLMVDANTHAASSGGGKFFAQAGERDGFAATRRAIVRAAAALDAGRMDGEKAPGQTSTG